MINIIKLLTKTQKIYRFIKIKLVNKKIIKLKIDIINFNFKIINRIYIKIILIKNKNKIIISNKKN